MSKLYFFRHAQASFLANDYDQLSPKGEAQAVELGNYLVNQDKNFDQVFVGPLKRQVHTYEIVNSIYQKANKSMPEPQILSQLKEHEGTEGVNQALPQLLKMNPQIQIWVDEMKHEPVLLKRNNLLIFKYFMDEWAAGNIEVPSIESWRSFRKNVKEGLSVILDKTDKGQTNAVFTSGGTISSIAAESLNIQDEKRVAAMNFALRNTSFSTFLYSAEMFNLLSFNELPHLEIKLISFV